MVACLPPLSGFASLAPADSATLQLAGISVIEPTIYVLLVDTTNAGFIFEITGAPSKIDKFVGLMRPMGLLEVSRTGVLSIERGAGAD